MIGFRVYRSATSSDLDWDDPDHDGAQPRAMRSTAHDYTYEDTVSPGVTYYYLLRGGVERRRARTIIQHLPASAWLPTPPQPHRHRYGLRSFGHLDAGCRLGRVKRHRDVYDPRPTATRRYTNTPVVSPLGTPTRQVATPVPLVRPRRTPLPPASVATPTGRCAEVTIPPTLTRAAGQPVTLTPTRGPATLYANRGGYVATGEGPGGDSPHLCQRRTSRPSSLRPRRHRGAALPRRRAPNRSPGREPRAVRWRS